MSTPIQDISLPSRPDSSVSAPNSQQLAPKVALVCTGIGWVQRGYERYFTDLFHEVRHHVDATLFKGGGPVADGERVVWNLRRDSMWHKIAPVHALTGRSPYHTECLTFGLSIARRLRAGNFDLVHVIDPPLGKLLHRLRGLTRSRYRLLYTEGAADIPGFWPRADHVHQVGHESWRFARESGVADDYMTLLPCGVRADRFTSPSDKSFLRRHEGLDDDVFVILAVGALNRTQKRVHHIIEEVSKIPGNVLLWLDGHREDPSLIELAATRLGSRCRVTRVSSDAVADLYRIADIFVAGSVKESFGLAIVEAMCSGLPVLTHHSPHFRWLVGDESSLLDMLAEGALSQRLMAAMRDRQSLAASAAVNALRARERFDWSALAPQYAELYRRVSSNPERGR